MCTVTYIPSGKTIYLTSNRDEKSARSPAVIPEKYDFPSGKVVFPKDGDAGGSWIVCHENGNAVVLLNGAHKVHESTPPYRKSRGLILLDLIDHTTPFNCFLAINLNRIEPFTVIIRDNQYLFECRWDGQRKSYDECDPSASHIWSSVTLYDTEMSDRRKHLFKEWMENNSAPTQQEIIKFHQLTGVEEDQNGLMMSRSGEIATVSITSMAITSFTLQVEYVDVKLKETHFKELELEKTIVDR